MRKIAEVLRQLSPTQRSALLAAIDSVQEQAASAKRCVLGLTSNSDDVSQFMGYLRNVAHYAAVVDQVVRSDGGVSRIEYITANLRWSESYCWPRMRERLQRLGIDAGQCILADIVPDDDGIDFGLIVTEDRRVFEFVFRCIGESYSESDFTEWKELTAHYQGTSWESVTISAFSLLDGR